MNEFAPFTTLNTTFVVRNIASSKKTVNIFHYPILANQTRDLLKIPGVGEADIRASLLKGELLKKIRANEIEVIESDIDLLQFNNEQKSFLQESGVVKGLEVSETGKMLYKWVQEISLIGDKNNINRTFTTPDKFLNGLFIDGSNFHIQVKHNGKDLYENIDYTISESGGPGTGYDTINIISFPPKSNDILKASYTVSI